MMVGDRTTVAIEPHQIIEYLKKNLQVKEIWQKLLQQKIINKAAEERNLIVTPEEIQAEATRQRREKRLEKAADTLAWLEAEQITPEDWELGICDRLLKHKLAEALFAQEIEKIFAQSRLNFEQVILYQIIIPYERLAWEIFYQIEEEEMSFYQAAHLYDIDEERKQKCGYEGKLYRWSIQPDIAATIFNLRPKEVSNPQKSEQGYHLLMVEEFIPAQLTSEIYQEILNKLFDDWLAAELNYLLHNSRE
jgi:parvulin-like peptidyl-prolyl isomerase